LVVGAGLTATTICGHTYATTEPTLHTVSIWQLGFPSLTGALYLPKKEKEIIRVLGTTPIAFRIDTTTFTACNVLLRVRFEEES
jgi:hypothetical protein